MNFCRLAWLSLRCCNRIVHVSIFLNTAAWPAAIILKTCRYRCCYESQDRDGNQSVAGWAVELRRGCLN